METTKKIKMLKIAYSRIEKLYASSDNPQNPEQILMKLEGVSVKQVIIETISDLKYINQFGGVSQLVKFANGEEKQQSLF